MIACDGKPVFLGYRYTGQKNSGSGNHVGAHWLKNVEVEVEVKVLVMTF